MRQRPRTAPPKIERKKQQARPAANIKVYIRVRPETRVEKQDYKRIVKVLDENVVVFDAASGSPRKGVPAHARKARDHTYAFDRVFGVNSTQEDVFQESTLPIIESVLTGYNATVFAYGATGAGKTFTMMGTEALPGVMVLTMEELFRRVDAASGESSFKIGLSYLEVYNETIHDLLCPSGALHLREDPVKGAIVAGLSEHYPSSVEEVFQLLAHGTKHRSQSPTEANAESSRSHAVLQIRIHKTSRTAAITSSTKVGTLSLIDLAGSERAKMTKNRGERLVEGANINRSLLALGNCINALCSNKSRHVPYRNSKLTRLLKDSLGGNCMTVMLACLAPSSKAYEDTHNTLKYANRAKEIKTKVNQNVVEVDHHIAEYTNIIKLLQEEISELKVRVKESEGAAERDMVQHERQEMARMKDEMDAIYKQRKKLQMRKVEMEALEEENEERIFLLKKQIMELKQRGGSGEVDGTVARLEGSFADCLSAFHAQQEEKAAIYRQMAECENNAGALQATVPNRLTSPTKRAFLQLLNQMHELELNNKDLEDDFSCVTQSMASDLTRKQSLVSDDPSNVGDIGVAWDLHSTRSSPHVPEQQGMYTECATVQSVHSSEQSVRVSRPQTAGARLDVLLSQAEELQSSNVPPAVATSPKRSLCLPTIRLASTTPPPRASRFSVPALDLSGSAVRSRPHSSPQRARKTKTARTPRQARQRHPLRAATARESTTGGDRKAQGRSRAPITERQRRGLIAAEKENFARDAHKRPSHIPRPTQVARRKSRNLPPMTRMSAGKQQQQQPVRWR